MQVSTAWALSLCGCVPSRSWSTAFRAEESDVDSTSPSVYQGQGRFPKNTEYRSNTDSRSNTDTTKDSRSNTRLTVRRDARPVRPVRRIPVLAIRTHSRFRDPRDARRIGVILQIEGLGSQASFPEPQAEQALREQRSWGFSFCSARNTWV